MKQKLSPSLSEILCVKDNPVFFVISFSGKNHQQIVDAEIPYVAFDRIIDGVASSAVSNVKGDNEGIGVAAAAYFVSCGMQPGDEVYVYEGDTSSVTTLRDQGFKEYLLGNAEFEDATIEDSLKWTEEQVESAITYSGAMNWSRSDTKTAFGSSKGAHATYA